MNRNLVVGIASSACLAGLIVWRMLAAQHTSVVHSVDVHDISRSHFQGCEVFEALARDAVRTPGISSKSTLTVLITGDRNTANEPVVMAQYKDLKSTRAVEGKNADAQRLQAMLQDVANKCGALKPTSRSPIFLAIGQGLAILRSQGCSDNSRCVLNIDTDGQENADRSMQIELNASDAPHAPVSPRLDNDGVDVRFCGLASTAGRLVDIESREVRSNTRNAQSDEWLRQAWTGLFTAQNRVRVAPFCRR